LNQLAVEKSEAAEWVPWEISLRDGSTYVLRNRSDQPKFKVLISGPGVSRVSVPSVFERVDGRGSVDFRGTTERHAKMRVEVTWHHKEDHLDAQQSWSDSMPPPR
jgi:hypothetical protein